MRRQNLLENFCCEFFRWLNIVVKLRILKVLVQIQWQDVYQHAKVNHFNWILDEVLSVMAVDTQEAPVKLEVLEVALKLQKFFPIKTKVVLNVQVKIYYHLITARQRLLYKYDNYQWWILLQAQILWVQVINIFHVCERFLFHEKNIFFVIKKALRNTSHHLQVPSRFTRKKQGTGVTRQYRAFTHPPLPRRPQSSRRSNSLIPQNPLSNCTSGEEFLMMCVFLFV